MKLKSEREVTQSCPTLSNPVDCSLPCSSIHGIFQARVLEWAAIAFSILRSIAPLQCLVNVNYRVLICCTCLFQSGALVYFGFLCLQVYSVPNFCPDRRGQKAVTCLGSLVHLCSGEGGTLQTKYHWPVWGVLAVYGPHCLPPLQVVCASQVYTAQAPRCSAGALSHAGLRSLHFPGLSDSGSQELCKGTDLVGHVFCALPRSKQLG